MSCDSEHPDGFSFQLGKFINEKILEVSGFTFGRNASGEYLQVNASGSGIKTTPHIADTEYRNLLQVLAGKDSYYVEAGDVYDIIATSPTNIVWKNENGVYRNLRHNQQNIVYRRLDSTNLFSADYNSGASVLQTGTYNITAKIEIISSGNHASGWIDLYRIKELVDSADTAGTIGTSTDQSLPIPQVDGEIYWVTDQFFHVYSKNGDWYKLSDDTLWKDMPTRDLDFYLLLGQSNMHGGASLTGAPSEITDPKTDVMFRTAWHHDTSDATTQLYQSGWRTETTAGNTHGQNGNQYIGGSNYFGPELGFAHEGKSNGLFGTNTPALFKYAVGSSSLFFDSLNSQTGGDLSDWDTTANLANRNGDCWRGFKQSFDDAVNTLKGLGHRVFFKGAIWYQGESDGSQGGNIGAIQNKLQTLWDEIKAHALSNNISSDGANLIVTRISDASGNPVGWGDEYKRLSDTSSKIGIVDATIFSPGNNIHLDQDGMWGIGKAYAREMKRLNDQTDHTSATDIASTSLVIGASSTDSTIVENAGVITSVSDLSANNNDWTPHSNSTIELVTSGSDLLYNENVLKFDADADTLHVPLVNGLSLGDKVCFFQLFNPEVNGHQDSAFCVLDTSSGLEIITILPGSNVDFYGSWYHHTRTQGGGIFNSTAPTNGWNLISWEIDTNTATTTSWINGHQIFSVADGGTLPSSTEWDIMGNHNAPSGQVGSSILNGLWAEFYAVKDSYDREKIEGAIMHKYGLARNLPANHPYREIVP